MTALLGGLPKKATESMPDFIAEFIDHVTPDEWRTLRYMPKVRHVTELVTVVVAIRKQMEWPLPYDNPLNPASRYEVAS